MKLHVRWGCDLISRGSSLVPIQSHPGGQGEPGGRSLPRAGEWGVSCSCPLGGPRAAALSCGYNHSCLQSKGSSLPPPTRGTLKTRYAQPSPAQSPMAPAPGLAGPPHGLIDPLMFASDLLYFFAF